MDFQVSSFQYLISPHFRSAIVKLNYRLQGIIMFLQSLPTQTWGDHEIEVLLAEAYVLSSVWHNAQSHLLKGD